MLSPTCRVLVAVIPDLSEPGGSEILEEIMERGDEFRLGRCTVIEADMDALALIDEAGRRSASLVVLFGPKHVKGRDRGVYLRRVEPAHAVVDPSRLAGELWGNLTGSLKLLHYEMALRRLYRNPFLVAECEPGGLGCRGLLDDWLREFCRQS